jgi:hypothetical protein
MLVYLAILYCIFGSLHLTAISSSQTASLDVHQPDRKSYVELGNDPSPMIHPIANILQSLETASANCELATFVTGGSAALVPSRALWLAGGGSEEGAAEWRGAERASRVRRGRPPR